MAAKRKQTEADKAAPKKRQLPRLKPAAPTLGLLAALDFKRVVGKFMMTTGLPEALALAHETVLQGREAVANGETPSRQSIDAIRIVIAFSGLAPRPTENAEAQEDMAKWPIEKLRAFVAAGEAAQVLVGNAAKDVTPRDEVLDMLS
jgi:hypothetical protein